jgi:hypothetical protein
MSTETGSTLAFCENCGAEMTPRMVVCQKCGYEVNDRADGLEPPVSTLPDNDSYDRIPGTQIALGDGEKVWRSYAVTQFPTPRIFGQRVARHRGGGNLYVTNARVMFFATYERRGGRKRSMVLQETQVGQVTGVTAFVSRSVSLWTLIVVGLIGLLGLGTLANGSKGGGVLLLIIAGFGAFLISQGLGNRGNVGVRIHSSSTQASPLGFGELGDGSGSGRLRAIIKGLLGPFGQLLSTAAGPQDASDLLLALPGPDAERVVVELGALIADLQSKGSLAGTHWGVVD